MEPKFQTSFIPKQSLSQNSTKKRKAAQADLLFIVAMVLFLASIAMAGGVFIYSKFTDSNIEKKSALLEEAESSYNPELIATLSRTSRKMNAAEEILGNHISATSIFRTISDSTLKSIKFDDFKYEYGAESISVSMKGEANGFSSIALQSDVFGESKAIRNPIFSDLTLNNKGKVEFLFTADIEPSAILYRNNINGGN